MTRLGRRLNSDSRRRSAPTAIAGRCEHAPVACERLPSPTYPLAGHCDAQEALLTVPDDVSGSRTDIVYNAMKRRIVELSLPPGSHFTEAQIAGEWGVSKTPVRDALARLRREGLVDALPRAGYRVTPVTLNDAADLCAVRRVLTVEAAELTAVRGLPGSQLQQLQEIVPNEFDPGNWETIEAHLGRGAEFEAIIANGSGNSRLAAMVLFVIEDLERIVRVALRIMPWSPSPSDERQAIVDAIRAQDGPAARAAMLTRTGSAEQEILGALMQSASVGDAHIEVPAAASGR
jgi:DNA-binding GntR family transcriptional regulator